MPSTTHLPEGKKKCPGKMKLVSDHWEAGQAQGYYNSQKVLFGHLLLPGQGHCISCGREDKPPPPPVLQPFACTAYTWRQEKTCWVRMGLSWKSRKTALHPGKGRISHLPEAHVAAASTSFKKVKKRHSQESTAAFTAHVHAAQVKSLICMDSFKTA